jgi:hypothetical protein
LVENKVYERRVLTPTPQPLNIIRVDHFGPVSLGISKPLMFRD